MLTFKVLKHKTLPDTFGVFQATGKKWNFEEDTELYHCSTPELLKGTATFEDLKKLYHGTTARRQMEEYELVTVCLTEKAP